MVGQRSNPADVIPITLQRQHLPNSTCFVCKKRRHKVAVVEIGTEKLIFDEDCLEQLSERLAEMLREFLDGAKEYAEVLRN